MRSLVNGNATGPQESVKPVRDKFDGRGRRLHRKPLTDEAFRS
jgi:hypothetical protein